MSSILGYGHVDLIDSMGDDLTIVNAARVSYAKRSESMTDADAGLIKYLMKNRHGTPFEQVVFSFRIRVPIAVAREWQRHRIGSFNEESTRYIEMRQHVYVPAPADIREQVGRPGHYKFETLPGPAASEAVKLMGEAYEASWNGYQALLSLGVAKELARNVLPLGLFTEFVWTVNLRSLFNFLSLRTAPSALREIRYAAEAVFDLAYPVAPRAFNAWVENGKVSP